MKARSGHLVILSLWALSAQGSSIVLGNAEPFAVLGFSTVTNTGTTNIFGSVGLSPGSSVTGFPPGIVHLPGVIHIADADAGNAQIALTNAYITAAGPLPVTGTLTGLDLGGRTLTPGVYKFGSSAQLTGTLTLNPQNDPNAVFVFQIGSTLTTAPGSKVVFLNSLPVRNLFWQVGTSATLDSTTQFAGNILAQESITMVTGASIDCGRALASTGAVTMDSNTVSIYGCAQDIIITPPGPSGGGGAGGGSEVPEPGTAALFGVGLLLGPIAYWRRSRNRAD